MVFVYGRVSTTKLAFVGVPRFQGNDHIKEHLIHDLSVPPMISMYSRSSLNEPEALEVDRGLLEGSLEGLQVHHSILWRKVLVLNELSKLEPLHGA